MENATSVWVEKVKRLAARRVTGYTKKWQMEKNKEGEKIKVFEQPSEIVKQ